MAKKMTTKKKKSNISIRLQLLVATGIVCLLVIFGCIVALLDHNIAKNAHATHSYSDVTLKGTPVCLPLTNSTHSQTLACAEGIKTTSGHYYALQGVHDRSGDNTIEVTGTLTAPPQNSAYPIDGVLTIQ